MGIIKSFFIFMLIFLQHPVQPVFELLPVDDQPDLIIVENIPQITPDVGKLHTIYLHADGDFTKVNEGVTWHSSNEAVASVDQIGNIRYTGRSGKAYISVTDGVKKDRIKIGVTKDKINVVKEEAVKYNIIYDALNSLTLEEKIGQMLMPDFRTYSGKNVTKMMPEIEQLIKEYHLGGVILFAENLVNTEQTVRLVHEFQEAAEKFGLLLTIDQEGGMVTRLQTGTDMPGNMAIGATRSPDLAAQVGNIIGTELAALGINMNLAPVVDINNNPDNPVIGVRSFSEDPKLVAELGIALTDAMQATGVAATAKHFPGHGDTTVDSHLGLPEVPHDKERLSKIELFPFQQLMDSGIDAIMTAHVTFPNIDAEKAVSRKTRNEVHVPATLSHKVLTELMRNEMGFNGVVMTDAMNMKAITDHFGPVDAAVRAINAGADIILMPVGISDVFQGILDAVNSGEIPVNRIDESVERILTLKVTRGILKEETPLNVEQKVLHALQVVSSQEHQKIEADVAAKSITLVKNDTNVLPIDRKENKKIIVVGAFSYIDSLFAEINSRYENVTLVKLESNQSSLTSNQKQQIQESDLVIIGSFTSSAAGRSQTSGLVKAYNEVLTIGKPSVAVALGNPYDVMAYPGVNAYIAQYGFREASFEATADVIFGITKPTGKLPVTIPSYDGGTLFEFGTGLHY